MIAQTPLQLRDLWWRLRISGSSRESDRAVSTRRCTEGLLTGHWSVPYSVVEWITLVGTTVIVVQTTRVTADQGWVESSAVVK